MRTRLNCIRARRTWKRRWPTSCSERTCTMQSNSNRGRNCCTATQRETRAAWLFLLPSLTGVVLFVLLPFAETVRRSLFDTMGTVWVGLSNYRSAHTKRCLPIGRTQYGALFGDLPADSSFRQPGTGARAPQPSAAANTGCPHLQNHLFAAYCDSCGQHWCCCGKPCLPGRGCATVG